jgi:4-amino-4-deoxy-L-arabinose transferase-like glycosyltransferase
MVPREMGGRCRQRGLLVLAVGVLSIAGVLAIVASRRSWRRVGYNGTPIQLAIGTLPPGAVGCQPYEALPSGTQAVQIHAVRAGAGSVRVRVELREAGRYAGVGAAGAVAASGTIVAPLAHPLARAVVAPLCVWNTGRATLALLGAATGAVDQVAVTADGKPAGNLIGRVRVDDLNSSRPSSLWSVLGRLPERIASATGSALAPWLVIVGLIVTVLAAGLLMSAAGHGRGRESALVAVMAFAIGAAWAGITPMAEKTDETPHFAYVQAFAELGHPPTQFADTGLLSPEFACWYSGLGVIHWRYFDEERPPWSAQGRRSLDRSCAAASPKYNGAMYMAFQPPAYYALAAGAYKLAVGASLPTKLLFARLVSVLLAALAVVFTYLLARELIRESLWPARAAALAVALQPIFMFNESGVNPDALMVAVASAIALVGARAWRKGLSTRRALGLGALVGLGVVSKTNFLALIPSVLLLAGALWWGAGRQERSARAKRLAAGAVIAGAIFGVYALVNDLVWHRGLRYRDESYGGSGGSLHRLAEFTWQFFLPRLSEMNNLVGGTNIPIIELIESSTTRMGWWNDYGIASGWTPLIMAIGLLLAGACAWYVIPRARRHPAPVIVTLGCALAFLAALVYAGYQFSLGNNVNVIIPRHALPLISLWGLLVGCAVAAARPRWQPIVTGLLAVVFLAHTTLALTTTVSRFYL